MRLPRIEVARRKEAVLTYFRKDPTASVAKLNAALKDGSLTGKVEKMLNIATGYKWRKEAIANPELPLCSDPECVKQVDGHETKDLGKGVVVTVHERPTEPDDLPASLEEHAAAIEVK